MFTMMTTFGGLYLLIDEAEETRAPQLLVQGAARYAEPSGRRAFVASAKIERASQPLCGVERDVADGPRRGGLRSGILLLDSLRQHLERDDVAVRHVLDAIEDREKLPHVARP